MHEPARDADEAARSTPSSSPPPGGPEPVKPRQLGVALLLFAATCVTTTLVGANQSGIWSGLAYSVPLMAILLSHELGHYVAARIHGVRASLPYFIPMPLPPLGTMGAVILMRDRITTRNALHDIGAAGPLAGMAVALPVLVYGIAQSKVAPISTGPYTQEGHSLLYVGLLYLIKGPFAPGEDIMLSPTAFAGWVGLLVTMINLIPSLQLDGGHVAYALLGERYDTLSRRLRSALLPLAIGVGLYYGLPALQAGKRGDALMGELMPASQWLIWWLVLTVMARMGEREHPPTDPSELSPRRKWLARATLGLFVLLFMPAWMRTVLPVE